MEQANTRWLQAVRETVLSYRRMIDGCVEQLSDEELARHPARDINSVAIILRHLGGNLRSRWTSFLTTDGEKTDRDRDAEFTSWQGDRASLLQHFDGGWHSLVATLQNLNDQDLTKEVLIRGESHSVQQAINRSITHIAYHVGQIAIVSRMVHDGDWKWLTIQPGDSRRHNERTWGTSASRAVFGDSNDAR